MYIVDRTRAFGRAAAGAVPFAGALAYALIVVWHGTPALRHDWAWPTDAESLASLWTSSTSGWDPSGIGAPNLHLNDYLVGGALCMVGFLAGAFASLFALVFGVGLACSLGAAALAGSFHAHPATRAGAALFALFNPWVYVETVAGHTYMLLAFGALAALVAEARRTEVRPRLAALLVAVTLVQLQFFLPALAIAVLMGCFRRAWLPLVAGVIVGAPVVVGLVAEYGAFSGVPVTLTWELSQSAPVWAAAHLSGYFAAYTAQLDRFVTWPMGIVLILVLFGIITAWRTIDARLIATVAVLSVATAAGLRGPLSVPISWAFTHVSAAALYRELFDVLGFAAIAYIAAASLASARSVVARGALVTCGFALFTAWVVWSPWAWWVPAQLIPRAHIDAPAGTRFALLPAFQPLTLGGRGSGLDPDAFAHGSVTPLNVQAPQFPIDAALARYTFDGDARWLASLGVSDVAVRPWFHSDRESLAFETALAPEPPVALRVLPLAPAQPRVALITEPEVVTTIDQLGEGNVIFSDAADAHGDGVPRSWSAYRPIIPVRAPDRFVNAKDGWVNARLTFTENPLLAQAFGGAATTSAQDELPVITGTPALVFVFGRLIDQDGRTVSDSTVKYRWVKLAADVSAVRCRGLCVVAAQGFPPQDLPALRKRIAVTALIAQSRAPWFVETNVASGDAGALRLNEAYDRNWIATSEGKLLPHVRIDTAVNGWLLPARTATHAVLMIQWAAGLQALLEAVGALCVIVLAAGAAIDLRARA